jgi:hypothetical protein
LKNKSVAKMQHCAVEQCEQKSFGKTYYCETAGLIFDEVIDLNRLSQMNVFQSLGHPFIPFNYIRILGCAAW